MSMWSYYGVAGALVVVGLCLCWKGWGRVRAEARPAFLYGGGASAGKDAAQAPVPIDWGRMVLSNLALDMMERHGWPMPEPDPPHVDSTLIWQRDGIDMSEAPTPPRRHVCEAWTVGVTDNMVPDPETAQMLADPRHLVARCACGGFAFNGGTPYPGEGPMVHWMGRNESRDYREGKDGASS